MVLNGNGSAMGLETSVHMKEFFSGQKEASIPLVIFGYRRSKEVFSM